MMILEDDVEDVLFVINLIACVCDSCAQGNHRNFNLVHNLILTSIVKLVLKG